MATIDHRTGKAIEEMTAAEQEAYWIAEAKRLQAMYDAGHVAVGGWIDIAWSNAAGAHERVLEA